MAARAAEAVKPFDTGAYETVTTVESLDAWIAEAIEAGVVAVDTETTALDANKADLVGVSLATAPRRAATSRSAIAAARTCSAAACCRGNSRGRPCRRA